MRMTNDEFQAEVFRRAAAYQQRQRTRFVWVRRTALAVGCLAVVLTGLAVYPGFGLKNSMMMNDAAPQANSYEGAQDAQADYAADNAEIDAAPEQEREASEDCAEEAVSAADSENHKSDLLQVPKGVTTRPHSDSGVDSPEESCEDDTGLFTSMTEAEMLQWYGITSLPDTLAGLPLLTDRSDAWYSRAPQLGVITDPDDPELVQSDLSIWIYCSESSPDNSEDYSSRRIYIYLQTAQDGSSDEINCEEMHDYTGSIAAFSVRGLSVYMEGKYFSTEEMKAAAEELRQALV